MTYQVSSLSLPVVQRMKREKSVEMDNLVDRKNRLMIGQYATTREELETELAETISSLEEITTQIASMPDGPLKARAEVEQSRLNTRKLQLQIRINNNDGDSVPEREFELEIVQYKIDRLTLYIADLDARETELNS
jgi:ABC-type phosphate transport system auxiliary subunit